MFSGYVIVRTKLSWAIPNVWSWYAD